MNQTTRLGILDASKAGKRARKRDYPLELSFRADVFLDNHVKLVESYNISYPAFRDYKGICDHFRQFNNGITPYAILTGYGYSQGSFPALYHRLRILVERGLVYCVDRLYYPTDKGISELNKLLEGV